MHLILLSSCPDDRVRERLLPYLEDWLSQSELLRHDYEAFNERDFHHLMSLLA